MATLLPLENPRFFWLSITFAWGKSCRTISTEPSKEPLSETTASFPYGVLDANTDSRHFLSSSRSLYVTIMTERSIFVCLRLWGFGETIPARLSEYWFQKS